LAGKARKTATPKPGEEGGSRGRERRKGRRDEENDKRCKTHGII